MPSLHQALSPHVKVIALTALSLSFKIGFSCSPALGFVLFEAGNSHQCAEHPVGGNEGAARVISAVSTGQEMRGTNGNTRNFT